MTKLLPAQTMRLGTQTGSLVNHVMSESNQEPIPGMGATLLMWTDRKPYTIHKVEYKKFKPVKIWVTGDLYRRTDKNGPYTESQDYEYQTVSVSQPEEWQIYTFRKNGRWVKQGQPLNSTALRIGTREAYIDPSF